MKKLLGYILIGLPVVVFIIIPLFSEGLTKGLLAIGIIGIVIGCLIGGFRLLEF